jgi:hypothetical protein
LRGALQIDQALSGTGALIKIAPIDNHLARRTLAFDSEAKGTGFALEHTNAGSLHCACSDENGAAILGSTFTERSVKNEHRIMDYVANSTSLISAILALGLERFLSSKKATLDNITTSLNVNGFSPFGIHITGLVLCGICLKSTVLVSASICEPGTRIWL